MATPSLELIAFYLPQYHPIPENDRWWGTGFTEWTNVVRRQPLFAGHQQPHTPADLGYYDLRVPEVRAAQAEMAAQYGISGFCYYHYWFHGRRVLQRPFNEVLQSGEPDFPFCLCWANENWTRSWDGLNHNILLAQKYSADDDRRHMEWLVRVFEDERYIRIDGLPLFLVYRASSLANPLQTTDLWRAEARRHGIGEIYLCRVESFASEKSDPTKLGFNAAVEFQPDWEANLPRLRPSRLQRWTEKITGSKHAYQDHRVYDYQALVAAALSKPWPEWEWMRCITPGWDNTPRRDKDAVIYVHSDPTKYANWLYHTIQQTASIPDQPQVIFINAWNEWGEGNHLEPCRRWKTEYLQATLSARREVSRDVN